MDEEISWSFAWCSGRRILMSPLNIPMSINDSVLMKHKSYVVDSSEA